MGTARIPHGKDQYSWCQISKRWREERLDSRSALCKHGDLRLPGTATITVASAEGAHEARLGLVTSAVGSVAPAEGADVTPRGCYICSVYMDRVGMDVRRKRAMPSPQTKVTHVCPGAGQTIHLIISHPGAGLKAGILQHQVPRNPGDLRNAWLGKRV